MILAAGWALIAICEFVVGYLLVGLAEQEIWWTVAVGCLLHGLAAALCYLVVNRHLGASGRQAAASAAVVLAFTLPVIGVLYAAYLVHTALHPPEVHHVMEVAGDSARPPTWEKVRTSDITGRLADDLQVHPVIEQMQVGDQLLKMSAIEILAKLGEPETVPVLRDLLQSAESDVRFTASVALSRLEDSHSSAIKSASEKVLEAGLEDAVAARSLGNAFLDYVESGLVEGQTAQHYAASAARELQRSYDLGQSSEVLTDLAKSLLLAGQFERCLEAIAALSSPERTSPEALILEMQARYSLGDFDGVRRAARLHGDKKFRNRDMRDLVAWWSGTGEPSLDPGDLASVMPGGRTA